MRPAPFSRPTIVAATELLDQHSQAGINRVVIRLGLESEVSSNTDLSVRKKCALIARAIVQRPDQVLATVDGLMTLGEAVVREAVKLAQPASTDDAHTSFLPGLARDGFVLVPDIDGQNASIRAALPNEIQLPATDDDVHHLLRHFGFIKPLGHFDQAIDAHTRGDWAACNAQLRSFLESLFDDIARLTYPQQTAPLATSDNRRKLLGNEGFLDASRGEWSTDGKNYVNGLFKMLYTHGSHPGLSNENHSTFRLHVVLVTGRHVSSAVAPSLTQAHDQPSQLLRPLPVRARVAREPAHPCTIGRVALQPDGAPSLARARGTGTPATHIAARRVRHTAPARAVFARNTD